MARDFLSTIRLPRVASLPGSANQGDAVVLTSDGLLYVYDGSNWIKRTGPLTKTVNSIVTSNLGFWYRSSIGVTQSSAPPDISQILDYSGNSNTLSQGTAADRPHLTSGYIDFDGVSQYIEAADAASLDPTTAFTLALRIKPDVLTGGRCWISKSQTSGSGSWSVQYSGELRFWTGVPGVNGAAWSGAALTAGAWHTILFRYASSALRCRINGAEQTIATSYGTIPASLPVGTDVLRIASFAGTPSQFFDGAVAEVVGVNAALTDQQMLDLEDVLTNGPTSGGTAGIDASAALYQTWIAGG